MLKLKTTAETNRVVKYTKSFKYLVNLLFRQKITIFATVVILLLIITAIFAPFIAPYNPYVQDLKSVLQQPSAHHLLGTDQLGRDTLSRLIYASRISLLVGIVSVCIAASIGVILGLIAGFFGSWISTIIMRFMDALLTIPLIIFALTIGAALGGGINNVIIALGIALIPVYCRTMYALTISIKQNEYVLASRAMGSSNFRIMFNQILPNAFPPFMVLITLQLGIAILAEAGLSFLGLGISPPGAAWGSMVYDGYGYLMTNPILSLAPGFCIMIVVLVFNQLGDALRDILDPRLRGII